ncbi:MAG: acetylornithine transaminase [Magnetococcus sp. WYHC-3]
MTQSSYPFAALMRVTPRPERVFVRGEGSWLFDHEGRRYLDFIQGWAVNCLGHSPRVVVQALADQARELVNPSPAYFNAPALALAQCITTSSGLDQVYFANSGAEANEGAIKLARKWGQKHKDGAYEIITTENSFHGRTLATMSASGKKAFEPLFEPKVPGFIKVPYNDAAAVEAAITPRTVAVMLEPIQGEGGVIEARPEYLRQLAELAQRHKLLLIFDEVQTGFGRTGQMYGFQQAGVRPDIMTLGKSIGAGVPLAALVASNDVCCFEFGDQGGTYGGNPLMTAVGLAVYRQLNAPGFFAEVNAVADYLTQALAGLSRELGLGEVRGRGMLQALVIKPDTASKVASQAFDAGVLINAPRPDTLRLMPALTVTRGEIDLLVERLRPILAAC